MTEVNIGDHYQWKPWSQKCYNYFSQMNRLLLCSPFFSQVLRILMAGMSEVLFVVWVCTSLAGLASCCCHFLLLSCKHFVIVVSVPNILLKGSGVSLSLGFSPLLSYPGIGQHVSNFRETMGNTTYQVIWDGWVWNVEEKPNKEVFLIWVYLL